MGFLDKALRAAKKVDADKVRAQVGKAVDKHGEKITGGIDKAAAAVDQRTGGKHSDKIAKAQSKAKEGLEKLDGRPGDDAPGGPR
ncbi:antitoxin [Nocardioides sp. R-C-SC26]|uniref:antitoxin n=1 Tax=Nocardioides sp. R-C-SC26 TaxID=2870414 RepID=UPI001E4D9B60|nr:antitoxin [Nocardioides sp. R-C-SC26]